MPFLLVRNASSIRACERIALAAFLSLSLSCAHTKDPNANLAHLSQEARVPANGSASNISKAQIARERTEMNRNSGVVQLTGKDIVLGQTKFPNRTPADPVPYVDPRTGEVFIYGTQVDGTGFSYLKYKNKNELLRGAPGKLVASQVFLPNGKVMKGAEAVWDTYRLPYSVLQQVFTADQLQASYRKHNIVPGTDLYYGGIALSGKNLGKWTEDNWRRRVHAIAPIKNRLQIIERPVFNPIDPKAKTSDYPGFGHLKFLPGDYIGHAYGPNFKLVKTNLGVELWIISEEVTRRVNERQYPAEVTEIVARKMISPFEASETEKVLLVSVNGPDNNPHPDSDRGEAMRHTKLIEGFRPTSITPEGIRIDKRAVLEDGYSSFVQIPESEQKEFFFLTGSPGNFAGDDYDSIVAVRESTPIGPYKMISTADGRSWKRFLAGIKKTYNLSWAGRGSFLQDDNKEWWLLFHAVDKDLKPDGSYGGVIPANTPEYHRNLYAVPVEFFINLKGEPDMIVRF